MKKLYFLFLLPVLFIAFVKAGYSSEEKAAYTWAFNNWITTMSTIDKADMNWEVTRIALAKMISNYAIKTLKKKWDTTKKCVFTDVTSDLDKQYDNWVTIACQLWLMGQWITKFRPYDKVTRAEFWTILSRLLYWDKYNWWDPYYQKHLNQLKGEWIITNILNPDKRNETRGNVMVMLKRSKEWWVKTSASGKIPSYNELEQDTSFSCHFEALFDGQDDYDAFLPKKSVILPYKDWYFWYDYDGQDWLWFYIYYRLLSDMCNPYIVSDVIFRIPYHGGYETYNKLYYYDSDVYYSDYSNIVKTLNCDPKDQEWCLKEADKYVYNLLVWNETNEFFTLWMDELKRRIDNHQVKTVTKYYWYTNTERSSLFYQCFDETKESFKDIGPWWDLYTDEARTREKRNFCINSVASKYCRYKYINACSNWVDCEKIKQEADKCYDITVKTELKTDERFPWYGVIYWWTWAWVQSIVWGKTIYYNEAFWIKIELWEEYSWWVIDNDYRTFMTPPHYYIFVYKKCDSCSSEILRTEWYSEVFQIDVLDKNTKVDTSKFDWTYPLFTWSNNKHYFRQVTYDPSVKAPITSFFDVK